MEDGLFSSDEHALAASLVRELLNRAEQACRNSLRARKRGVHTDIPESGAKRTLSALRRLREGITKPVPTWAFVYEVVMLSEALPPPRAEKRLRTRTQKRAAKKTRKKDSIVQRVRESGAHNYAQLRKLAPDLVTNHSKAALMQALSRVKSKK
jgi:hypothetical protein